MTQRRGPRLVLAAGALAGLVSAVVFPATDPGQVALASDLYYAAARAALAGRSVYATTGFLYPPPVVVAFYPHALLDSPLRAFVLQTALNLASLAAVAATAVRVTERAGVALQRVDRALVAGFVVACPLSVVNLVNGQVNPQLALAIAGGAVLLERDRQRASGVAFGLPALVKLFPALVGAWLLRRRAWTAIAAATATGLGLVLAGAAAFGPGALETYVTQTLTGELSVGSFAGGPDASAPFVTVRRQLAVLAPGLSGSALLAASLLLVAPVVAAVNRAVDALRTRLVALQGTLLATLVAFPLEPLYYVLVLFPLVPLLYLLDAGTPRRLFLAGGALVAIPVTYQDVTMVTGAAAFPDDVGALVEGVARPVFAFVTPTMVGVWLVLGACLLVQHRAASSGT